MKKNNLLKKPTPYFRKRHGKYGEIIMDKGLITYECHLRAYAIYSFIYDGSQSADRLADKGGFNQEELDLYYPEWKNHILAN